MDLIIVESPTKARTIGKYLGRGYAILSSYGHVREIPSRNKAVLPDKNFKIEYEVSDKAKKNVKKIIDTVKKVDHVFIASDPDREGESIAWHIAEILKKEKVLKEDVPVKRIVFHEITKQAVTEALAHPRNVDMDLVNAQQARRALDYLVGFTLSPILWRKLPGSRSAGRVQSVALRLICDREDEVEAFVSQEYWSIECNFENLKKKSFISRLVALDGKKLEKFDLSNEKEATKVVKELSKRHYSVKSVEKKQQMRNPYPPFITSSLQIEASRKLGFGAKRTMQTAQRLYEGVDIDGDTTALITYMRTDGVTLSKDAVMQARNYIQSTFGDKYLPNSPRMYKTKVRNAQEAHEAIRPIDISMTPEKLRGKMDHDQWRLYDLIWKRTVACQMSNVVLNQVHVVVTSHDGYAELKSVGTTIAFDGFYRVYSKEQSEDKIAEKDEALLPILNEGEELILRKVDPEQHFTEPPPRYTEASLVKKLEELSIGRPSTYASIISVLQDRKYVKLDNKRFLPEERGRLVTAFLVRFFDKYVEYDFTARLEDQLDQVSNGKLKWKDLLEAFWFNFHQQTEKVGKYKIDEVLGALTPMLEEHVFAKTDKRRSKKCPSCKDGELKIKISRFGPFIACSGYPECKYTRRLERHADADSNFQDKSLGVDPETNEKVFAKKGPYGFYLQLGEMKDGDKESVKRAAIPKSVKADCIDLKYALKLLSLPRVVCMHPTSGLEIKAGIGKFSPYLLHDGRYARLPTIDKVFDVTIDEAVHLVDQAAKLNGQVIGQHEGSDVSLHKGRFGAYIKWGDKNIKVPRDTDVSALEFKKVVEIIKKSGGAAVKKKATKKSRVKKSKK